MRKRQTFADIFALCSNLLAYVYEKRMARWCEAVYFRVKTQKNILARKGEKAYENSGCLRPWRLEFEKSLNIS